MAGAHQQCSRGDEGQGTADQAAWAPTSYVSTRSQNYKTATGRRFQCDRMQALDLQTGVSGCRQRCDHSMVDRQAVPDHDGCLIGHSIIDHNALQALQE